MKLLVVLTLIACSYADKLDRTYLPPASAATAGGAPGSLTAPGIDAGSLLSQAHPNSFGQLHRPINVDNAGNVNIFENEQKTNAVYSQTDLSKTSGSGVNNFNGPSSPIFAQSSGQNANVPESNFTPQSYTPERSQAAADRNSEILRNVNENDGDSFSYSYETSNGISAEESGVAINGVKAQGGFSYTGDDGKGYAITYTADENGYLPQGEHLPTPHPIPEEILKSIEVNAKAAATGNQEGAYRPEENESENYPQQYNGEVSINQAQGQDAPYNYKKPFYQAQKQQGLPVQNNRVNAVTENVPYQKSNQFISGSRPQQGQLSQYSQISGAIDNGSPNRRTDKINIQRFSQRDEGQGANGYNYNRPETNLFGQNSFGQQFQQTQKISNPKTTIPFGSPSSQEAQRPFSNNETPSLTSSPSSQYPSNMNRPSFKPDGPLSQSPSSETVSVGLETNVPLKPIYQPNQNQQDLSGFNRLEQETSQYRPTNPNLGSKFLDRSSATAGYQYKRPSQSFNSFPSQSSTQYNNLGQSLLTSPYGQSQLTSTSQNLFPSQYKRPDQASQTSPFQASFQNSRPGQSSLTPSSQNSNPSQSPYQYNHPGQSSFMSRPQTISQYNRPGQSLLIASSLNSNPSQALSQYNRPDQSFLTSPSQASSQYNRPGQSLLTPTSQNSSPSHAAYQYNRPSQSLFTSTPQPFSQYNRPGQSPLTSVSQNLSPSQAPYQYKRPSQTSLPPSQISNLSPLPSQYNRPGQSPLTDQPSRPSQVTSQNNRPAQSSFTSPSQSLSQYKPDKSSPSTSSSQAPYQYERPVQASATTSLQRPNANGLASQTGTDKFQAKPEQFGGPRPPPTYSPEEGYKY